ncbi:MAG TPA: DUF2520 domain-containing protein [Polyangiales bacterium]|nr:DUF2520 domain-containing protein [Polyangiales bacterium]
MTMTSARIGVLGLGRLGACLARALCAAGVTQISIATRQRAVADLLGASLGAGVQVVDVADVARVAELLFIAVPDGQLQQVAAGLQLSAAHSVVHLSGVLRLDGLAAAAQQGAKVGALHPLQAFPRNAGVERFVGIYAGVEASDPALVTQLEQIARALGATPFSLAGVDRAAYHAGAVFASNYAVALHAAAARVWQAAGLPLATARLALAPLTLGAAQAIAEHDLAHALTGPIARGDVSSVASHLRALSGDPDRAALYRALARELLGLPLGLTPEVLSALQRLLDDPS